MKRMKKQHYIKWSIALFCMIFSFSGCKFVREVDIHIDDITPTMSVENPDQTISVTENPVTIVVEKDSLMDEEAVLAYFYGMSREELLAEDCVKEEMGGETLLGSIYTKDGIRVSYAYENEWNFNAFSMTDTNYNAGSCYLLVLESKFMRNEIANNLIRMYPEGELDSCSKEEAIAACAPLAAACGYKDALVTAYVMKKEVLNNYGVQARLENPNAFRSAPHAEYNSKNKVEWQDEHEAYFLVYRSVLNGRVLDTTDYMFYCVYVPALERVVYAFALPTLRVTETLEETELISAEEAAEEVLRMLNVEAKDVTITGISMVYSPRYDQANETLERRTIDPCWRIDYELSDEVAKTHPALYYHEDDGTILINAIDGKENKYSRG